MSSVGSFIICIRLMILWWILAGIKYQPTIERVLQGVVDLFYKTFNTSVTINLFQILVKEMVCYLPGNSFERENKRHPRRMPS